MSNIIHILYSIGAVISALSVIWFLMGMGVDSQDEQFGDQKLDTYVITTGLSYLACYALYYRLSTLNYELVGLVTLPLFFIATNYLCVKIGLKRSIFSDWKEIKK